LRFGFSLACVAACVEPALASTVADLLMHNQVV
jgi:hypothetical protein